MKMKKGNFLTKLSFFIYAKVTRKIVSGFNARKYYETESKLRKHEIKLLTDKFIKAFSKLCMYEFSILVGKYPYKKDNDWEDHTILYPGQFFLTDARFRDCDDWAFIWSEWGKLNEYKVHNYASLCYHKHAGHAFTILEKDNRYFPCNTIWNGKAYKSLKEALISIGDYGDKELSFIVKI